MHSETMSPQIKQITCQYIKEVTFDFVMTSCFGCYDFGNITCWTSSVRFRIIDRGCV